MYVYETRYSFTGGFITVAFGLMAVSHDTGTTRFYLATG